MIRRRLTHLDERGRAAMVDVGGKRVTARRAVAEGFVRMSAATLAAITAGTVPKGEVLNTARIAGIQAAKRTGDLIPLCHPLGVEHVSIDFKLPRAKKAGWARIGIEAVASISAKTGVEMEALTAVTVAALTIYDMCKAIDRGMMIERVRLIEKTGGSSGSARAATR